jgi:iron complex outermembrane receptor protein
MVYASSATGTKSGNFNGVTNDSSKREFEDEHTMSYELGIKSTLFDSRLRLNSALFYSKVTDFQFQEQTDFIGTFVSNDGEVEVSGLDISIDAMPLPFLTLNGGLLYMDKYEITEGVNKGKKLPFTADVSGNIGGTVMFPMADGIFYMRTDYVFMSEHLTGSANAGFTDERNLVNTNIGWRTDELNVSVWVKNLTEDKYASAVNAAQAHTGNTAHVLAQPRTIGATVRYNFY